MDEDESWDIDNGVKGDVSFFYTLLHELGHSLGLGHSSKPESIMYPWYSNKRTETDLYDDDIFGIEQLYGPKPGKSPYGPITPYRTTRRTTLMTRRTTTERPRELPSNEIEQHSPQPENCDKNFNGIDAIGMVRGEMWIFKDTWMWRFRDGRLLSGQPAEFTRMFEYLKDLTDLNHIDAVFERKDGKFVFFSGRQVIVHNGNQIVHIHDLEYLGIKRNVEKIDAIFTYARNNKTYIFSGEDFWK